MRHKMRLLIFTGILKIHYDKFIFTKFLNKMKLTWVYYLSICLSFISQYFFK